jgi:hypothetical protein
MPTTTDCASKDDLNVLTHLMNVLDFKNPTRISPRDIARHLDMLAGNVQGAISRLVDDGVLIGKTNAAGWRVYHLNPHFGDKKQSLAARMEAARIRLVA